MSVKKLIYFFLFMTIAYSAHGSPTLLFSDLIDGPDTGLGDGKGVGSIVTVWGHNLGTPSITGGNPPANYDVYFTDSADQKRSAAYIYYWCNADGGSSGGGPADLYSKLGKQEIAFSIPDSAAGLGTITVEVDGVETSAGLPFTVRSGSIYFVGDTGGTTPNNSNAGTFAEPFATANYSASGALSAGKVPSGSIIYMYDAYEAGIESQAYGSSGNMVALIAYPGHQSGITAGGWSLEYGSNSDYFVLAKMDITALSTGIAPEAYGRYVGNAIWDGSSTGTTPGTDCANGQSGAISTGIGSGPSAVKVLGNYIHDWGCQGTSSLEHTTYFGCRESNGCADPLEPLEVAYNYLIHNEARGGLHFFDEHGIQGYTESGPVKIHGNWVEDQVGPGFNFGMWNCDVGYEPIFDFEVYNNIIINAGQYSPANSGPQSIYLYGDCNDNTTVKIYNNVIYGSGYSGSFGSELGAIVAAGPNWSGLYPFNGAYHLVNNIIYDVFDVEFFSTLTTGFYNTQPTVHTNNVWYDPESTLTVPTWDTDPITTDPKFTTAGSDFSLQSDSPCKDSGADPTSIFTKDFYGVTVVSPYDIGPIQYGEGEAAEEASLQGFTIKGGSVR